MLRRDSMTKETLLKEGIWLRFAYSFRGLVHCHHGGGHDSVWLGMVLESQLGVLCLNPQAAKEEKHWAWIALLKPQVWDITV